jgi:antirestriction protein ArdC
MTTSTHTARGSHRSRCTRTAAQAAQARAARDAKLAALHAQLNEQIEHLLDDDAWRRMLALAARFHRYSPNNVLLLLCQAEKRGMNLTYVAGFHAWKKLGRSVCKGEKGLAVLAPAFVTKRVNGEDVIDADTGEPVKLPRFTVEYVFDVSQTDGEPLPTVEDPELPDGAAPDGLIDALGTLIERSGFSVTYTNNLPTGAHGQTSYTEGEVRIHADLPAAATAAVLAHELGHIRAEHETRRDAQGTTRPQREAEADSIAYIVCAARGLDNLAFSAPYVAGWSAGDPAVVQAAFERVQRTSSAIVADVAELLDAPAGDVAEGDGAAAAAADGRGTRAA